MMMQSTERPRLTQPERRARTYSALIEAAARRLSRHGYANLNLEQVALDAGYSKGALYHLFGGKDDLALAVVRWVEESWYDELGHLFSETDPVRSLLAIARGHAVFCRRGIARVMMTLRLEFDDDDHPVSRALNEVAARLVSDLSRLVTRGRRLRAIPPGPSPRVVAVAYLGAIEGVVINLSGREPFDETLASRAVAGILGVTSDG